jgi:hypothetical protein
MSRQTRTLTEDAADRLETHRGENESFSEFALRVAAILDDVEAGTSVTETAPKRSVELTDSPPVPGDVLTEAHIDDIAARTARIAAQEIESRLR